MILEIRDLAFGYGARAVGSGVSLTLQGNEALCLLGPNGGGKTTLFKTMLGLLRPLAGRVLLDGIDLATLPRREIAKKIAYVPQAHAAFFPFTVREVVLMGRASRLPAFASPGPADHAAAERALLTLGIGHLGERIYTEISGGERQLALIARALAGEPRLLVMDEPTASLDFGNQARVLAQVRRLSQSGIAVVLSTHDPGHAFLCADRVALLHGGRLVALGPPSETVTPEHLRLLYGVEVAVVPLPGQGRTVCTPLIG
ncbi:MULTISPECIES: ABC transporter ATP-binding protein [Methylorubrum]|uniref:ABC transporter ATP-binding protein n=1 Tax=Methylorubrum TaxID=2282523 RepID=UPI0020A112B5|nr:MULTISPECIES: ABC transporter ATP-binding protein [Methylorubrum]MCP1549674.1 iron complex transport system ATP-binding protein [Methylorubrum zatmanii]MCP1553712.1 iron complex transport system ATP-binding protein [Methylorubrum extorquens]MCP1579976.1 iron complex transport system ATP-binding protein [Methylorubrum extorquens]